MSAWSKFICWKWSWAMSRFFFLHYKQLSTLWCSFTWTFILNFAELDSRAGTCTSSQIVLRLQSAIPISDISGYRRTTLTRQTIAGPKYGSSTYSSESEPVLSRYYSIQPTRSFQVHLSGKWNTSWFHARFSSEAGLIAHASRYSAIGRLNCQRLRRRLDDSRLLFRAQRWDRLQSSPRFAVTSANNDLWRHATTVRQWRHRIYVIREMM